MNSRFSLALLLSWLEAPSRTTIDGHSRYWFHPAVDAAGPSRPSVHADSIELRFAVGCSANRDRLKPPPLSVHEIGASPLVRFPVNRIGAQPSSRVDDRILDHRLLDAIDFDDHNVPTHRVSLIEAERIHG